MTERKRLRRLWFGFVGALMAPASLLIAAVQVLPPDTPSIGFGGLDINNKDFKLESMIGQVVILNFWATWCGPCRFELPKLVEISKKFKTEKVKFLGLSVDDASNKEVVKATIKELGIPYQMLMDSNHVVVGAYNPKSIVPYTVVIDAKGKMRFLHEGYEPGDEVLLEQEIRTLLKEASTTAPKKSTPAGKK